MSSTSGRHVWGRTRDAFLAESLCCVFAWKCGFRSTYSSNEVIHYRHSGAKTLIHYSITSLLHYSQLQLCQWADNRTYM